MMLLIAIMLKRTLMMEMWMMRMMRMMIRVMRMMRMRMRMMRLTRVAVVRRGPVTDMRVSSGHSIHLH